ncbi:hypothetical protein [Spirosoma oryzicola]|uniref:hypothetical protein n=1 Tax=Spirosoma oryzicola TaxID=2898794 RepID=UPI001E29923F|nr:hypothetical protein [Spirosoma oryzicola]UHG93300.1 hypothetical protein LQ777_10445 [Spirosoma oryzicola]
MEETKKKDLSPVAQRLLSFVEQQGGYSVVAKRLNKHPQFLYNIRDGKAKPSYDTLMELWQVYKAKFDLMYVMTGTSSQGGTVEIEAEPVPAPVSDRGTERLEMENASLKRQVELLEDTVSILRNVVSSQLGKELKTESANESTQGQQLVLGLTYAERKAANRFVPVDFRDALGVSKIFPNQAPIRP